MSAKVIRVSKTVRPMDGKKMAGFNPVNLEGFISH